MTIDPVLALPHRRRDHADQPMVGDDVVVEDLAELIVGDAAERAVIGIARGVADQHVDLAERARPSRRRAAADPPSTRCWRGRRARVPAPWRALIAAATSSQAAALREETTTFAPCSASRSTMARPMPREEPVTTATLPVRSNSDIFPRPAETPRTLKRRLRNAIYIAFVRAAASKDRPGPAARFTASPISRSLLAPARCSCARSCRWCARVAAAGSASPRPPPSAPRPPPPFPGSA